MPRRRAPRQFGLPCFASVALLLNLLLIGAARSDEALSRAEPDHSQLDQPPSTFHVTGYADAAYVALFPGSSAAAEQLTYHEFGGDSCSLALNQAALSLASQTASGFGGVLNLMAGGDVEYMPSHYGSELTVAQAFGQFALSQWTFQTGRYLSLTAQGYYGPESIRQIGLNFGWRDAWILPLARCSFRISRPGKQAVQALIRGAIGSTSLVHECERKLGQGTYSQADQRSPDDH